MPVSKAQIKATNKYNSANYDNLRIVIPKGRKAAVEAFAKSRGESVNGLINRLIKAEMGLNDDWEPIHEEEPVSPVHEKAQKYLDKVQKKAKG